MEIKRIECGGNAVAIVSGLTNKINNAQTAMDIALSAKYKCDTSNIVFDKECFDESFFILSSGIAGEILQKFTNYGIRCAIFGNYSHYTSKPLRDFIYESNKGHIVGFLNTEEEALNWLLR